MAQTSAVSLPRTSRLQPELPQTTGTIAGIAGQLVLLRQPCLHIILSRVCADCLPSNRIQPSPGMRTLLKFTVFSRTRLPFSNCLSLNMTQLRAPLRVTIPKPRLERDSIIVIDPNSPSPSRIEKEGLKFWSPPANSVRRHCSFLAQAAVCFTEILVFLCLLYF